MATPVIFPRVQIRKVGKGRLTGQDSEIYGCGCVDIASRPHRYCRGLLSGYPEYAGLQMHARTCQIALERGRTEKGSEYQLAHKWNLQIYFGQYGSAAIM